MTRWQGLKENRGGYHYFKSPTIDMGKIQLQEKQSLASTETNGMRNHNRMERRKSRYQARANLLALNKPLKKGI